MDVDNLFDYLRNGAECGRREFRLVVTDNPIEGGLGFYIHPLNRDGVTMTITLIPEGGPSGADAQETVYSGKWSDYPLTLEDLVSAA